MFRGRQNCLQVLHAHWVDVVHLGKVEHLAGHLSKRMLRELGQLDMALSDEIAVPVTEKMIKVTHGCESPSHLQKRLGEEKSSLHRDITYGTNWTISRLAALPRLSVQCNEQQ